MTQVTKHAKEVTVTVFRIRDWDYLGVVGIIRTTHKYLWCVQGGVGTQVDRLRGLSNGMRIEGSSCVSVTVELLQTPGGVRLGRGNLGQ